MSCCMDTGQHLTDTVKMELSVACSLNMYELIIFNLSMANIGVVYFQLFPSLILVSLRQVVYISLRVIFNFPSHRHQVGGNNAVSSETHKQSG